MINIAIDKILITIVLAIAIGQALKFLIRSIKEREVKLHTLIEDGGMPSGHSTLVSALSMIIGLTEGFSSAIFLVTLTFSLIVLRDAFGVRRSVDKNIAVINELISKEKLKIKKISYIVGHTPQQVAAGIALGAILAITVNLLL